MKILQYNGNGFIDKIMYKTVFDTKYDGFVKNPSLRLGRIYTVIEEIKHVNRAINIFPPGKY